MALLPLLVTAWCASPTLAAPQFPEQLSWKERRVFTVAVRPMTVSTPGGEQTLSMRLEPERGASGELDVYWPTPEAIARVELRARDRSSKLGDAPRTALEATVLRADGRERHASRMLAGESGTALFEIDREGDRGLVLALSWDSELEPFLQATPSIGAPVRFWVDVERALDGRVHSLESNQLNSFVGESVGYAFRLGQGDETEALRLRLNPILIEGDVLTLDIEVEGRLPGESGPRAIAQRRRAMLSSGAATLVPVDTSPTAEEAAAEAVPDGYRFKIRALF